MRLIPIGLSPTSHPSHSIGCDRIGPLRVLENSPAANSCCETDYSLGQSVFSKLPLELEGAVNGHESCIAPSNSDPSGLY